LVVISGQTCFVVECKASPPVEPFRDPGKAFERLKRHFTSDRGIQKAYEQGLRIWAALTGKRDVPLYDKAGTELVTLRPSEIDEVFIVCATRDNFGAVAVNLDLLLEKDPADPYPWAVNSPDLASMADAWQYFGWGSERLIEYLRDRVRLHGRFMTSDELEVTGYFIRHATLSYLLLGPPGVRFHLDPTYSYVFDDIYRAAQQGGAPVRYEPKPPVTTDMRESLDAGVPIFIDPSSGAKKRMKIGRNETCPCGSGKKFKRCHGTGNN
jgi:hypothetical protein